MPKKRHKWEEIVAKLRQVNVMVSQGQPVAGTVRPIGVTLIINTVDTRISGYCHCARS